MDVAPVESGEFTATHPGVGDEMQRRVQPQTAPSSKELGELLGVPDRGAEAERRGVIVDVVINDLAARLPIRWCQGSVVRD